MRYTEQQLGAITKELQQKFIAGEAKNYEIVIALLAMSKSGRIMPEEIRNILFKVFFGNVNGVMKALELAREIVDKDMIDEIIKEVSRG